MSSTKLQLKIVTPERLVFDEEVEGVTIPTMEGEITVLPGHIPLISAIQAGDVVAIDNGEHIPFAVAGGFLQVNRLEKNTEVVILADFAEQVAHMTDEAIEKARARAEEIRQMKIDKSHVDFEHFESELERSITRVKIADKWKTRKYRK
jgi:F-type H+-transporting ATPase subunit epsilon